MSEKTFKTRIQLKYDSYASWVANNPVLKAGEMAIVEVPAESGAVAQEPAILFKVGDGTKPFSELPWASGKAADVYSWAKSASKPAYQATEISGIDTYIAEYVNEQMGISVDTDTQYSIVKVSDYQYKLMSKSKADTAFNNEVAVIDIPQYDDTDLNNRVTSLETAVGTGGSVDTKIQSAIGALDVEDAEEAGKVVSAVSETDGKISVTRRNLVTADIPEIAQSKVTGLVEALAGKQGNLEFNTTYNQETNKVATMADVQDATAGLAGAMHYVGESTANPATDTPVVADVAEFVKGDVVTYNAKEYVYNGTAWRELGDESSFAVKGSIKNSDIANDAAIEQSKIAGLADALAAKATPADITTAIGDLDINDAEVAGQFVVAVPQENGKVAVTRKAVNVNVIEQTEGDVIIFDCGNSVIA